MATSSPTFLYKTPTTTLYRKGLLGCEVQSKTCLTTDAYLTADPGVLSSIQARSYTYVEIDAVNNLSDYRCLSDCRSRGPEFDPGLVPYFCGD